MSLSLASCVEDTGNNGSYDKEEFAVNFSVSSVSSIPKDTEFGIMASCTRNDVPGSMMSENVIQRYISVEEGKQVRLVPASEDDRVITVKGDHNFSFYGVYPFPEGDVDLQAVPVTIPTVQNFQAGITSIVPMIAYGKCSKVVATVNMDFKSIFSILEFNVPSDPVSEDEVNVLKSMKFRSASGDIDLAYSGTVDVASMKFTKNAASSAKEVRVDFGTEGFQIPSEGMAVQMLVAPFVVPEDGMELVFEDMDGNVNTLAVLSNEANTKVNAGESLAVQVSRIDDGIVPVTFPLYFPIGYPVGSIGADGKTTELSYCNKANQPNWRADGTNIYIDNLGEDYGVFKSCFQPQATAKWHWTNDVSAYRAPEKTYRPFVEFSGTNTGSTSYVGGLGVKGIWTGDYYEFDIPVKKFRANTKLQFTFAVCNKNAPVFWEVKYMDGEEWKTTAVDDLPAYEGSDVKRKATWAIPYNTSPKLSTVMTFKNSVMSGHLLIRLVCVDGGIVASGVNKVSERDYPYHNSGVTKCDANFYFVEKDPALNAGKEESAWSVGKKDQTQTISFTIL